MSTKNHRRTTAQEISIKLTKENLFLEKNVGGIGSATQWLDHYEPLKAGNPKSFKKQKQMWDYLKEGRPLKGLLELTMDQRAGKPYVWLDFQLPRGNFEVRFDILAPQMLEFITKYQIGAVSIWKYR